MDVATNATLLLGGEFTVNRLGFGAMRLPGPGVWGEPKDRPNALRVLRRAVEQNYCATTALQMDPLLSRLRGSTEYDQLLTAANECQRKFIASRNH